MYIEKTIYAGDVIIRKKYFSLRYGKKNIPRNANIQESSEQQKRINKKRSDEKRELLMLNNFNVGDWWITLTYSKEKRPEDIDEAHNIFRKLLQRIKRRLKRRGIEFKYMGKTEMPKSGAVHHHLVINGDIEISEIFDMWEYGSLRDVKRIYKLDDFKLADYFVKGENSRHKEADCRYTQSRNLVKPVEKVRIIKSGHWRMEPRPIKGYDILAGSVQNYNDDVGFEMQRYVMVKRC